MGTAPMHTYPHTDTWLKTMTMNLRKSLYGHTEVTGWTKFLRHEGQLEKLKQESLCRGSGHRDGRKQTVNLLLEKSGKWAWSGPSFCLKALRSRHLVHDNSPQALSVLLQKDGHFDTAKQPAGFCISQSSRLMKMSPLSGSLEPPSSWWDKMLSDSRIVDKINGDL